MTDLAILVDSRMSRTSLGIFSFLLWLTLSAAYPLQVGEKQVEWDCLLTYTFGESLTLKGSLTIQDTPNALSLIFQSGSQRIVQTLSLDKQGNFAYYHDFRQTPFRPFAKVEIWLEGVLSEGTPFTTDKKEFLYEDNRFPWKTRFQSPFRVHWRQGDLQFAQTILNVAKEAQEAIEQWLPVEADWDIDIYVYESPGELRQALRGAGNSWIGAHADPDLGVALIAISAGLDQRLQMEQQIPHELMHIYLYRYRPAAYARLPVWLREGLATAAEFYPNPDYYTILETARQNRSLLTLQSLCDTFPQEAGPAYLAYAQSAAVIQYLLDQYGISKIRQLIDTYADQYECGAGFYRTYGFTLEQLEAEWQEAHFGEASTARALANLAPWGILLLLVLFAPILLALQLVSHASSRRN